MRTANIFLTTALPFVLAAALVSVAFAQSDKGIIKSEEHMSAVAKTVATLTALAGKDNNIGEEVRAVAQEQKSSAERAAEAIEAVEARSGFTTFLVGTDYKNIGALKSEIVTTQNSIDRLTKAAGRATDDSVKAGLDAQIKALEETNTKALNFVKTNESKFSIFGWFFRLFQ